MENLFHDFTIYNTFINNFIQVPFPERAFSHQKDDGLGEYSAGIKILFALVSLISLHLLDQNVFWSDFLES